MPTLDTGYTPQVDAKKTSDGYEIKRQYVVIVQPNETGVDVELNVLNTSGLPSIGDPVSGSYPTVLCTDVSCSPSEGGNDGDFLTWYVDATFKTPTDDDSGDGAINPLNEAPVVSFGATQYERVVDKAYGDGDLEGEPTVPVENTIQDPFDPPIVVPKSNQYITIQQNLSSFDPSWIIEYENTTNKSSLTIVGVRVDTDQARMMSIRGNSAIDSNGNDYWVVSYEIEVSKEGFIKKILNSGLNHKVDSVGKVPIQYKDIPNFEGTDEEGIYFVNEPQKLLENGKLVDDIANDDPFYNDFKVYFSKSWSSLSIPSQV